jgi:tRNA-dihydrouridine synthase B
VMMGRAAYGRPWWPGVMANELDPGTGCTVPTLADEHEAVQSHLELMLKAYGAVLGNKTARKHVGWTLMRLAERRLLDPAAVQAWRSKLLTTTDNQAVARHVSEVYAMAMNGQALAA